MQSCQISLVRYSVQFYQVTVSHWLPYGRFPQNMVTTAVVGDSGGVSGVNHIQQVAVVCDKAMAFLC